jgi:acyl-CoA dehydrogenase
MRKTNLAMAFSYEQAMILDSAKAFCSDKSTIAAVRNLLDGETGFNPQVWQEMVALGWTGIAIPEEYGGLNLGVGALVPLAETMGRHLLGTPLISSALTAQAILRSGTESQRAAWLPALADGAAGALALLDNEDWGGDFSGCTVSGSGDNLTLTGRKLMVADGAVADLFVVSASHAGQPVLVLVEAKQLPAGALESKTLIDETKRACNVDFSAHSRGGYRHCRSRSRLDCQLPHHSSAVWSLNWFLSGIKAPHCRDFVTDGRCSLPDLPRGNLNWRRPHRQRH